VTSLYKDEKPIFERVGFDKKAREMHRTLAMDPHLNGVDLRVFLYLASHLDFENATVVPQLEIARALGRHKEHISRSIRKLKEKGVIVPGDKVGRSTQWRLNPKFNKQFLSPGQEPQR
jgi:hypothetical protein